MINPELKSISELFAVFYDEEASLQHLEDVRWNGTIVSPFDIYSKVYKCRLNRYRCKNTGKYFNAKTNTIFHNSKIELRSWFAAIWLCTNNPKITSTQLGKELSLTQKTAWFMRQKIREYLKNERAFVELPKPVLNDPETSHDQSEMRKVTEWLQLLKK